MPPALITAIDQVIGHFNARKLDLPDGFFDRRTQFVINGAPFETLLGQSPTDPYVDSCPSDSSSAWAPQL